MKTIIVSFLFYIPFLHIYVYEMHPVNGWFIQANLKDDVVYDQPKTEQERISIVKDWVNYQQIRILCCFG